jgi:methyl-accepting chemotaxis protein
MTIKAKLTCNVIVVLAIISAVAVTSVIGMGSVKSKLFHLTEQSTPFQMRTVEFQRAIQGMTSDLVKVSASTNSDEYKTYRAEAENSLSEVKASQDALEALSGGSNIEVYDEMSRIAKELFYITEGRLNAEQEAASANTAIIQRLKDVSNKLKELDAKIKGLQLNRSALFVKSLEETRGISSKLRNIELLKATFKDIQLAIFEIQKAQDKKMLIIARGKINTALNKAIQSEYVKESKNLHSDIKLFGERIEELVKVQTSMIGEANEESKNRYELLNKEIGEKLAAVLLIIEQEVIAAGDKYSIETNKQGDVFAQANISTNILSGNSELVSLGLSVEGLASRLFTVNSLKEVDPIDSEIKRIYERIDAVSKSLERFLSKLDAKEELKMLQNAQSALSLVRSLLFAKDGIIAKIRHKIDMKEKASSATERVRGIVIRQAEMGKQTVTSAQEEQEKAIGKVNKMVRFSTILIAAIGIGAIVFGIVFGTWIYRSVSKPLNELILGAEQIANGNLLCSKNEMSKDEIGMVQQSMYKMVNNLRDIVGKMKTSTESLASSSEELSATADALQKGSHQQTSQIEQSATAMTEMSQTTLDMAKNASHTAEAAQEMKKMATKGKNAMYITVQELQKFTDMVNVSAAKVESLGQKSGEIDEIITLIKGIADQTNLLALNAAIEAARAGEQGRGFAVVADEVRKLAERTTSATNDISNTVKAMQTEVADSVNFMRQEKESVGMVLEHVNSTLKSIDGIVEYVGQVADMVQRIAAATEEQSSASDDVSHNMESIAAITRQLGNSIGEIKRASGDLSKLATELNSMAGWFKV